MPVLKESWKQRRLLQLLLWQASRCSYTGCDIMKAEDLCLSLGMYREIFLTFEHHELLQVTCQTVVRQVYPFQQRHVAKAFRQ